jgi:hypothetical protein
MFVRWQLYQSQAQNLPEWNRRYRLERARLKAILVESVRIDGKPRQRHIAFLGSTCIDGGDRERFWYQVTRRLNKLRLSPDDRKTIGRAIAKKVKGRLLNRAQLTQYEQERQRKRQRMLQSLSRP